MTLQRCGLIAVCAMIVMTLSVDAKPTDNTPTYDGVIEQCLQDPAYRVGGAAIGECLQQQVFELDQRIADKLSGLQPSCAETAQHFIEAQDHWQAYRDSFCALLPALFDNTPMYINSQACALKITLNRLDELDFFERYRPEEPLPCESQTN